MNSAATDRTDNNEGRPCHASCNPPHCGGGAVRRRDVRPHKATPVPAGALKMSDLKLINYDFAKYGSAAERRRILEKWDKDVYALPR